MKCARARLSEVSVLPSAFTVDSSSLPRAQPSRCPCISAAAATAPTDSGWQGADQPSPLPVRAGTHPRLRMYGTLVGRAERTTYRAVTAPAIPPPLFVAAVLHGQRHAHPLQPLEALWCRPSPARSAAELHWARGRAGGQVRTMRAVRSAASLSDSSTAKPAAQSLCARVNVGFCRLRDAHFRQSGGLGHVMAHQVGQHVVRLCGKVVVVVHRQKPLRR